MTFLLLSPKLHLKNVLTSVQVTPVRKGCDGLAMVGVVPLCGAGGGVSSPRDQIRQLLPEVVCKDYWQLITGSVKLPCQRLISNCYLPYAFF